jgi:hypothetical protein
LLGEYEYDDIYTTEASENAGVVRPKIHWCFIGEIVRDASLIRPTFHVRDRDGKIAIISLYLDNESLYDPKNYVVGNTICVMYAFRKQFLDGSQGIRVEDGRDIQGTLNINYVDSL